MSETAPIVFLLDVDNTVLDNDRVIADLKAYLTPTFGEKRQQRYWAIFEQWRAELGYADYLGALQRYRAENLRDPDFLQVSFFLLDYPFADITIDRIGALLTYDLLTLRAAGQAGQPKISATPQREDL